MLSSDEMIALFEDWTSKYPIVWIEDPLEQDDWEGWCGLPPGRLGFKMQLVQETTCLLPILLRVERGIETSAANAVLVKMNQIGTVFETLEVWSLHVKGTSAPLFPRVRVKLRTVSCRPGRRLRCRTDQGRLDFSSRTPDEVQPAAGNRVRR